MMPGILNFVLDDGEAQSVVRRLLDGVPPGSYLVISHPTTEVDAGPMTEAIYAVGTSAVRVLLGDEGLEVTRMHRESRSVVENIGPARSPPCHRRARTLTSSRNPSSRTLASRPGRGTTSRCPGPRLLTAAPLPAAMSRGLWTLITGLSSLAAPPPPARRSPDARQAPARRVLPADTATIA